MKSGCTSMLLWMYIFKQELINKSVFLAVKQSGEKRELQFPTAQCIPIILCTPLARTDLVSEQNVTCGSFFGFPVSRNGAWLLFCSYCHSQMFIALFSRPDLPLFSVSSSIFHHYWLVMRYYCRDFDINPSVGDYLLPQVKRSWRELTFLTLSLLIYEPRDGRMPQIYSNQCLTTETSVQGCHVDTNFSLLLHIRVVPFWAGKRDLRVI